MAAGLPVVATRVGGVVEIVEEGMSELLVTAQNPQALAEAILRVLLDYELARRLARTGQEHVRSEFTFDRALRRLDQIYRTAVP